MIRRGHIVAVEFFDHVEGGNRAVRFVVYGRVTSITRREISVDCWGYADPKAGRDGNVTRYTIVRSAICKVTRLVPHKPKGK
jgi:hypothetical protein